MRGQLHTEFETITIHTAKCDICDQHNTSEMFRCTKCGRHCCKPCWDARGGDGRHTVHDKQRLAYTGPVAEPLPSAAKEKEGKDEAKKGKRERKPDAEEMKKGGRKKSLIVSLNVGKGKKRARDDGEDDLLEKDESSITSNGPAEGSAAAEHKRRRKASGGSSSSKTSERPKDGTPRKTAPTKTSPSAAKTSTPTYPPPTFTNPQPKPRQTAPHPAKNVPEPEHPAKLRPAPSTPGKANTEVPSTSLSPVTRVLLTQPLPQQRQHHLASANNTLMSLGEGIHTYSDNDDTEDEYEDEDGDEDGEEDEETHPTPFYHRYATVVNGHPNPNTNTNTHGIIANCNRNTAPTPAYAATAHSLKQEPPRTPTARDVKDLDGMYSLLSAAQMLETQNQDLTTSPLSSSSLLANRARGEMVDSLSQEEEQKMKKQHANARLAKRLARLDEGSEDEDVM